MGEEYDACVTFVTQASHKRSRVRLREVLLAWAAAGLLLLAVRNARGPHKAGLSTAFAMRSNV
jgi:hypothetical protein